MRKKTIEGYVKYTGFVDAWSFETNRRSYDGTVCMAIDELLGRETLHGEKLRITIEKIYE